ncbi:hypothetical protein BN7_2807 [Wickerhamomyces ciferrii]|uniref:HBS1-like protein N-terminal domain-containing protein n=1 Tax=Wickerhamomyces ciferrii (strain ATCC 14091 / BCRC 22168 / CBS 111 / JCM 3599 / NBRC 0793 / NRRL Y-1031 F-60-10) TaxID=1206466 RepID=K0KPH2_WICCF|nr:uncharacterized protein BN7_2807 [Wickerhamomyces ciferrii]CCH43259.1 hypothetical protein BN7_2807 [Wickerhamomyces ciferrii]
MNSEDEEKMDEMLPLVKAELKDYTGYTDKDITDSLWNNYFELEPTLKELKSELLIITIKCPDQLTNMV